MTTLTNEYMPLLRYRIGDYEGARKAVLKAIAVNPYAAHFQVSLGMILRAEGRKDASLAAFKAALKLNPKNRLAQLVLAGH